MWLFNNRKKTEEKKSDRNEMSDILSSYCLDSLSGTLTDLSGSDVWADIEKCDKKFRKSYFIEAQGLKYLKEEINNLEDQLQKLQNLHLSNTENYKVVSDKLGKAKKILLEQENLKSRSEFNKIINDHISIQVKYLGFDDFVSILKAYNYDFQVNTIDTYHGNLSESTVNLLSEIFTIGSTAHSYIYVIRPTASNISKVVTYDVNQENRLKKITTHGKFTKIFTNTFKSAAANWYDGRERYEYSYEKVEKLDFPYILNIMGKGNVANNYTRIYQLHEIHYNPLFDEQRKILLSKDSVQVSQDFCVEGEELDAQLPLYVNGNGNKPILFQTWCDGVIVYGFIENEHI